MRRDLEQLQRLLFGYTKKDLSIGTSHFFSVTNYMLNLLFYNYFCDQGFKVNYAKS